MDYQMSDEDVEEFLEVDVLYKRKDEKKSRASRYAAWTKEQTYSLILLLKEHPLLYDSTHPRYAQPIHRKKAYRDIHVKLQNYKPGVTVPEMQAKLKTLRSQYNKEKRKTSDKNDAPKLWCYDYMRFIDDRGMFLEEERVEILSAESQDHQVGEQPDDCYIVENENEIFVKSFDDSDSGEISETLLADDIKPKSDLYQKCLRLVEMISTQKQYSVYGNTPAALLGRMVETELAKFPEDISEDAKWKIIKVLEEASKKNKTINSKNVDS